MMGRYEGMLSGLAILASLAGCGGDDPLTAPDVVASGDVLGPAPELEVTAEMDVERLAETPVGVTYHRDVRPLLDRECNGCHVPAGTASFPLVYDPEEWSGGSVYWGPLVVNAVEARRMPPWTPDLACREILGDRELTPDEVAVFSAWAENGFAQGDPGDGSDAPRGSEVDWGPPDLVLHTGGYYTPDPSEPDDYRCFILDGEFAEDVYVTADETWPGEPSVVHHVIVYSVENAEDIATAQELDGESEELGYRCFGGPRVGGELIAGWVPGMQPVQTPMGSARRIPSGARLVMQVHYNTVYVDPGAIPSDQTRLALWTLEPDEVPDQLVRFEAFRNDEIFVPAGEVGVTQVKVTLLDFAGTVIGSVPHMHTFGRHIKAQVIRSGEVDCMVDIPSWDFDWQQMYFFPPSEWVTVAPGDAHRLTCIYDNDQAAQPWVGGAQEAPQDIVWGQGTFDEMCLNFLIVMSPTDGGPVIEPPLDPDTCNYIMDCYAGCEVGDAMCFLSCLAASPEACVDCGVDAIVACSQETCAVELGMIKQCLDGCSDGTVLCAAGPCFTQYEEFYLCSEPLLLSGQCDAFFEPCEFAHLEDQN